MLSHADCSARGRQHAVQHPSVPDMLHWSAQRQQQLSARSAWQLTSRHTRYGALFCLLAERGLCGLCQCGEEAGWIMGRTHTLAFDALGSAGE